MPHDTGAPNPFSFHKLQLFYVQIQLLSEIHRKKTLGQFWRIRHYSSAKKKKKKYHKEHILCCEHLLSFILWKF